MLFGAALWPYWKYVHCASPEGTGQPQGKGCVFSQGWEVSFSPCKGVTSTWTLPVARDLPASHVEVILARGCLSAESPAPGMVPGPHIIVLIDLLGYASPYESRDMLNGTSRVDIIPVRVTGFWGHGALCLLPTPLVLGTLGSS